MTTDLTPGDRAALDQFAADARRRAQLLLTQAQKALAEGVDPDLAAYSLACIVKDALASGDVSPDQTAAELAWLVMHWPAPTAGRKQG